MSDLFGCVGSIAKKSAYDLGSDKFEIRKSINRVYGIKSDPNKSFYLLTRPDCSKLVIVRAKAIFDHADELLKPNKGKYILFLDIEKVLENHKDYEEVI